MSSKKLPWVQQLLAPPKFAEFQENYSATVLNSALLNLIIPLVGLLIFNLIAGRTVSTWITASGLGYILIALWMLHRGQLFIPSLLTPLIAFGLITYAITSDHGIRDVGVVGYVLVIILAGLLFKKRGAVIFALICFATLIGIFLATTEGLIQPPDSSTVGVDDLVSLGFLLLMIALLLQLMVNNLLDSLAQAYQNEQTLTSKNQQLQIIRDSLEKEISERVQIEAALTQSAQLAMFNADTTLSLIQNNNLETVLQHCTEVMIQHLDGYLARIWLFNSTEKVLELQASAGRHTNLNGEHSRIPLGEKRLCLAGQDGVPYVINDIHNETTIDNNWAKQEGLQSIVSYPLMVDDQFMGVVAMFTQHVLEDSVLQALETVTNTIALSIRRNQAEASLQTREKHLRVLMEQTPVGILTIDKAGKVTDANSYSTTLLGTTSPDDTVGLDVLSFPDLVDAGLDRAFERVLSEGKSEELETWYTNAGHKKTHIQTRLVPHLDGQGKQIGVIQILEDTTDRQLVQEELAHARDQAIEASRLKSELLAKVSHELRTPLGTILGYSELLRDGLFGPVTEDQLTTTEHVIDSTNFLSDLVNELLDEAQLEAGKITLAVAPFTLSDLIHEVKTKMKPLAQKKRRVLKY
ncbi:MAG: histidine kinase dimerization/phospho-acceptor domain-containing protein, partial [Chloroflexota bacterium]